MVCEVEHFVDLADVVHSVDWIPEMRRQHPLSVDVVDVDVPRTVRNRTLAMIEDEALTNVADVDLYFVGATGESVRVLLIDVGIGGRHCEAMHLLYPNDATATVRDRKVSNSVSRSSQLLL